MPCILPGFNCFCHKFEELISNSGKLYRGDFRNYSIQVQSSSTATRIWSRFQSFYLLESKPSLVLAPFEKSSLLIWIQFHLRSLRIQIMIKNLIDFVNSLFKKNIYINIFHIKLIFYYFFPIPDNSISISLLYLRIFYLLSAVIAGQ